MSFLVYILATVAALGMQAFAQVPDADNLTPEQLQQLSQRFTTTIKETEVDRQLLTAPGIQECITKYKFTAQELETLSPTDRNKKREDAKKCFNDKFSSANESQLETLSQNLNLQSFGLVRGKGQEELRNYFSTRIQNALYGTGAAAEQARMKDMRIVDHKVYHDLYKSQLGSNFLLDISRYCYEKLVPTTGSSPLVPKENATFVEWEKLITGRGDCAFLSSAATATNASNVANCLAKVKDDSAQATSNVTDLYSSIESTIKISDTATTKAFLGSFFIACSKIMAYLCEARTMCNYKASQPSPATDPWANSLVSGVDCDTQMPIPKGEAACVTQSRLRDHRKNFLALNQLEQNASGETPAGIYAQSQRDMNGKFLAPGTGRYDSDSAADGDSIQGLTTPTTSELKESLDRDGKAAADEFDREGCATAPENSNCDKYFYTKEQNLRFQNTGLEYMAATAAEKQRINNLKDKKDDLKKYLQEKGYKDLADLIETGDATEIVAMAQARFETEREASYAAMEKAFQDQVQPTTTGSTIQQPGQARKQQLQNQGKAFQELLLFNNVISSYLQVEDSATKKRSLNTRVLEREVQTSGNDMADSQQFFEGLATSEEDTTRRDGTLELNQIDQFLSGLNDSTTPD